MTTEEIQSLPPMIPVARAAQLLGLGLTQTYAAVNNGDLDFITVNGRTKILTRPLLLKLRLIDE